MGYFGNYFGLGTDSGGGVIDDSYLVAGFIWTEDHRELVAGNFYSTLDGGRVLEFRELATDHWVSLQTKTIALSASVRGSSTPVFTGTGLVSGSVLGSQRVVVSFEPEVIMTEGQYDYVLTVTDGLKIIALRAGILTITDLIPGN